MTYIRSGKFKVPKVPPGNRVYAVGDIHGQRDLLMKLLVEIVKDTMPRKSSKCHFVFLGDYIDRGIHSCNILKIFRDLGCHDNMVFLRGNHEQILLDVCDGQVDAAMMWLKIGGKATLASFGVDLRKVDLTDPVEVIRWAKEYIDEPTREWIANRPIFHQIGDYYFVHAGVRPGRALARQNTFDQLWIRDDFVRSSRNHGAVIVHGHSVYPDGPCFLRNRIGIDTGAYKTGRLTALALEEDAQWIVDVRMPELISGMDA